MVTTDERQGAWSTRTAFSLRRTQTRNDLLFTMSDNTRLDPRPRPAKPCLLLDEPRSEQRLDHPQCDMHRYGGARRDRTDDLLLAKQALSQLSYGPSDYQESFRSPDPTPTRSTACLVLVGLGGLEPPTSRLSSARSNQLSYKPGSEDSTGRSRTASSIACPLSSEIRPPKRLVQEERET